MATNFLWYAGTSNNGLLTSTLTLMSTELNSIVNAGTATSTVGGSSGLFSNSNTAQGQIAIARLTLGAIASAVSGGGAVSCWYIETPDGSTFENTVSGAAQARPPDIVFPVPATTITAGWSFQSAGPVRVPALKFKLFIQNNLGQTLAASGNTIDLEIFAQQY